MYSKEGYHDVHYQTVVSQNFNYILRIVKRFVPRGSLVLDFGCGTGDFLAVLHDNDFQVIGVEFNEDISKHASERSGCKVITHNQLSEYCQSDTFDMIYMRDVFAHLPEPVATLRSLIRYLKKDGILIIEGPLEMNLTIVNMVILAYGKIKKIIFPNAIRHGIPTHLIKSNHGSQIYAFNKILYDMKIDYWEVFDTGWPYSHGGIVKKAIALFSKFFSGLRVGSFQYGNRFIAIIRF